MMVVFGSDGEADGTWGWAGERWMRLAPAEQSPPHRRSAAMVYDVERQVIILHGGTSSEGAVLNDTWEWNGATWSAVSTTGPARSDHTMVYDSTRHRTVLFGGEASAGTDPSRLSAQVWDFDGVGWTLANDPTPSGYVPTARHKHAASYDPIRNVMVIFGGVDSLATRRDTWEWNGSSWTQRIFPMRNAEPSESVAMAFDPDRGVSVVCVDNRSWSLCNDGWRLLGTGSQKAAQSPSLVFDTNHRNLVLCGQIDEWPFRHLATLNAPILSRVEGVAAPSCLFTDSSLSGDPDLYVDGWRWDGTFLQSIGPGIGGVKAIARMRMPDGSRSLVFAGSGGISGNTALLRVVGWDGSIFSPASGINGTINDVATIPNESGSDDLVIVGAFTADAALGTPLMSVARWNGSAWSQVGDGLRAGTNDVATATNASGQTTIYASGTFTLGLNGQSLSKLAQFTGGTWRPVGQGVDGSVSDIEVMRNSDGAEELYVAGTFSTVGTPSISNLARWNGQAWSALGDGPGAGVTAITVIRRAGQPDRLLVATSLSMTITRLQEWDGSTWTFLADIAASTITDLNLFPVCGEGDELFVSGVMTAEQGIAYASRLTNCGWTIRYPAAWPEARLARNFAYDSDRGVLVLVSGSAGAVLSDTWEFNGEFWTKRNISSPPGVYRSSMAYDPIRQKMVIYGGYDGVSVGSTTWEYDGVTWVARTLPGPGPRQRHAMAFDPERGVMVLFGGNNTGTTFLGDTWTYNGIAWTLASNSGPSSRRYPAMAFDPTSGRMLLYGGVGGSGNGQCLRDTWAWNGSAWTSLSVDSPLALELAAMAWDPHSHRMLLIGGGCGTSFSKSAAEWTGQEWLASSGAPSRTSMALVFYPASDSLVTFGGVTTSFSGTVSYYNDFTAFSPACVRVEPPPTPALICAGQDFEIPMIATGQPELSYAWQFQRSPVAPGDVTVGTSPYYGSVEDAEGSSLVLRNVPVTADGTRITCIVTSGDCTVTSRAVQLSVVPASSPLCPTCPSCIADFDENGGVEPGDIAAFFISYEAGDGCTDVDVDGGVTASDIAVFFAAYEAGGC